MKSTFASVTGLYVVRAEPPEASERGRPHAVRLRSGEKIGFDWDDEGGLMALAGVQRIPLGDGAYQWRYVPPHERANALQQVGMAVVAAPAITLILVLEVVAPGFLPRC